MAKVSVSVNHPDEEPGEVIERGARTGSAVDASVSSAMALPLQAYYPYNANEKQPRG